MSGLRRAAAGRLEERHAVQLSALRLAVLDGPGHVPPETRTAAAFGGPLPEPAASYVAKVRDHSYRITDNDVTALTAAGLTEDEIFELTVAAAVGKALTILNAGTRAMRTEG
jgi:alkylhydroperoxidase family enzyme